MHKTNNRDKKFLIEIVFNNRLYLTHKFDAPTGNDVKYGAVADD